jgi:hypothetical protein
MKMISQPLPFRIERLTTRPPLELISFGAFPFEVMAHDNSLEVRSERGVTVLRGIEGLAIWREREMKLECVKGPCEARLCSGGRSLEIRVSRGDVWGPEASLKVDVVDVRCVTALSLVLIAGARAEIAHASRARLAH